VNGLLLRDDPRQKGLRPWGEGPLDSEVAVKASKKVGYGEIVSQGRFWIIGAAYFAISYGTYTLVDFIVTYGNLELGLPYRTASFSIALIAFSGVAGGFLLMALSDRVGRKAALALTQALAGLGIFWILLAGRSPLGLMAGAAFFGFFYGAVWPMYAALGRDLFPREVTGTVVGLLSSFYGVGAMISPVVTGHLADVTGSFRWAFVIAGVNCLASVGLIGLLKKRPVGY
jgi:OFA family oxalate/formate antiporter-like MFS transporter